MRRQLSALFLVALILGTAAVSPAALRQFCEEHGRFCIALAFAAPSCAEEGASDCCGEVPCEEDGRCLSAPFPGEWVSPSAKGELEPPRWVDCPAPSLASGRAAAAGIPSQASLRPLREAPPPARGQAILAWFMVRLI